MKVLAILLGLVLLASVDAQSCNCTIPQALVNTINGALSGTVSNLEAVRKLTEALRGRVTTVVDNTGKEVVAVVTDLGNSVGSQVSSQLNTTLSRVNGTVSGAQDAVAAIVRDLGNVGLSVDASASGSGTAGSQTGGR